MALFLATSRRKSKSAYQESASYPVFSARGFHAPEYLSLGSSSCAFASRDFGNGSAEFSGALQTGEKTLVGSVRLDDRDTLVARLGNFHQETCRTLCAGSLLLAAYAKWGNCFLSNVEGDFSFAIFDQRGGLEIAARDRFGMRPLYYFVRGESLFISNVLELLLAEQTHPKISDSAATDFLLFGDINALDRATTMFEGVQAVPPAHCLYANCRNPVVSRYWDISDELKSTSMIGPDDAKHSFLDAFRGAVSDRCRGKVGVLMSGGMDSTSIAAECCSILPDADIPVMTAVADQWDPDPERFYSKIAADWLGLRQTCLSTKGYESVACSATFTHPSMLHLPDFTQYFERSLAELTTTALCGNAGDSVLQESPLFWHRREWSWFHLLEFYLSLRIKFGKPVPLGSGVLGRLQGKSSQSANLPFPEWMSHKVRQKDSIEERWRKHISDESRFNDIPHGEALAALDRPNWCADDRLLKVDFQPVTRVDPFLDLRMLRAVLSSRDPHSWVFDKSVLREAMADRLPSDITSRPKELLGHYHLYQLSKGENSWVRDWIPENEMVAKLVSTKKWRTQRANWDDPRESFLMLRPIYLERWLENTPYGSV